MTAPPEKRFLITWGLIASAMLFVNAAAAGGLNPFAPPGPTMRTLQEIYDKIADVERMIGGNTHSGNFRDYFFTNQVGLIVPSPFTVANGAIDYQNRGISGWTLKPRSISIHFAGTFTGPQGSLTDNGSGNLFGSYAQVPGGPGFTATGNINYQTGAWSITLSAADPFIETAQFTYHYIVSEAIDYAVYSAPVSKTGQTISYASGDDGELRIGLAWPNPRFELDAASDVVTDMLTRLMWAQKPHELAGNLTFRSWADALFFCNDLTLGGFSDWRLPNRRELFSLIDDGKRSPALPEGHPFIGIRSSYYWSSTTADQPGAGWSIGMDIGGMGNSEKTELLSVWPVRGPIPPEPQP